MQIEICKGNTKEMDCKWENSDISAPKHKDTKIKTAFFKFDKKGLNSSLFKQPPCYYYYYYPIADGEGWVGVFIPGLIEDQFLNPFG